MDGLDPTVGVTVGHNRVGRPGPVSERGVSDLGVPVSYQDLRSVCFETNFSRLSFIKLKRPEYQRQCRRQETVTSYFYRRLSGIDLSDLHETSVGIRYT